ncbi:hypothetical protein SDC9_78190 [bioreactor metagenome]|uniref:Secretion system C-terminal sorting domain-containing protein n=1 Tax=bioreactor metagenome TaxID=1076179 RepID=A0A644Z0A6_9ZZZZ
MKFSVLLIFSLILILSGYGQKGIGLEGRVLSSDNGMPVPDQKVFVVFEPSAQPYIQNVNNQLITASDGSFHLYAPDIPSTIIPLEVLVYTYDCDFQRKGFLITYNQNYVVAEDIEIPICMGPIHMPQQPLLVSPLDNSCPSYARFHVNDSLKRNYLFENYFWKINDEPSGNNETIDVFFRDQHNELKLIQTFTDSITGFAVDSIQINRVFDLPPSDSHIIGGNVLLNGGNTETGTAILLGKSNNNYFIIDTVDYEQYGYYYFTELPQCNYTIRIVEADWNMTGSSIPTYLGSALHWESATFINLTDDYFCGNIALTPKQTGSGIGQISGMLNISDPAGFDIILYDENMTPYAFSPCSINGDFHFDGLPYGGYYLYTEKFGIGSLIGYASLSMSNPSAFVNLNTVSQLEEQESAGFSVYPNPASEFIRIDNANGNEIRIFSTDGRLVLSAIAQNGILDVGGLEDGMYFLRTESDDQPVSTSLIIAR